MHPAILALRSGDTRGFSARLDEEPGLAKKPQVVLEAARLADREALERLAEAGADLDGLWRGYRPLHAVLQEEPHATAEEPAPARLACLEWLLERGADPELRAAWPPARALVVAAFVGSRAYVERILARRPRRDAFTEAALGEPPALARALERDPALAFARDGEGGLTALQCAAGSRLHAEGRERAEDLLACTRLLLDAGADPRAPTRSWSHAIDAAYLAVGAGHRARLVLLLERGADATEALVTAAWRNDLELVDLCLAQGAELDRARHDGRPLLNQLVRWGQVAPALALLERGASPNLADERGWTALHQAASRGNERLVRALLDAGADRSARDGEGATAAAVARAKGRVKLVPLLG